MTGRMADSATKAEFELSDFEVGNPQHVRWSVELWNDGTGGEIPITERFLRYNLTADAGIERAGQLAMVDGRAVGFVLYSAYPGAPAAIHTDVAGWIEAIAVARAYQGQGIGRSLLGWAEERLAAVGKSGGRVVAGGGLRPFVPGPVADSAGEAFFLACGHGYAEQPYAWDTASSLGSYRPPALREVAAAARPGAPGQEAELVAFLAREFPGRWRWQAERFLEEGGRISDYMLLWTTEGVQGACRLTFEDSVSPVERFFPYGLPRPWGQLGSIGVSAHLRGQGMGLYLLDAGLRRLHDSGVNGCVIDWTTIVDFYAKCGFAPYRKWARLEKRIDG